MIRFLPVLAASLMFAGCGSPAGNAPVAEDAHDHDHGGEHAHDDHEHGAVGPNGGEIIELGEHHAELVHDDAAGTVSVYILDGAMKENVPVDATEATINVTVDEKGDQFKLAASPVRSDPTGKSSRFVSDDATLGKAIDLEGAAAVFVVTIDGTQVRGNIEHHHEGHDHAHDH
jgi:hypothetical protein